MLAKKFIAIRVIVNLVEPMEGSMKNSPKFLVVSIALVIVLVAGATWTFAQEEATGFDALACTAGQIAKFDGTAWACADDLMNLQAQLAAMQMQLDPEAQFTEVVFAVEAAAQSGDVDRIMEFYADDVVTILPGMAPLVGKEAVRADWEYFFDTFTLDRDAELVWVDVSGDTAVRRMEWTNTLTPKDGSDPIVDNGNCIVGFKKVGDEWKIAWEIASTYE
jgi:ketosteroid isomerase-like protein